MATNQECVAQGQSETKSIGPHTIARIVVEGPLTFRRTSQQVRSEGADTTQLWFVRRGCIKIVGGSQCDTIARTGDLVLTRSTHPYFAECLADKLQIHETIQFTIPTHVLRDLISESVQAACVISSISSEIPVAARILDDLLSRSSGLTLDSSRRLLDAVISLVADALSGRAEKGPLRQSVTDRRIEGILRYIELHLCNPNLDTAMVCRGCGISPRYLTTLLQIHGASFSVLVWGQRLEKAKVWLQSSYADEIHISEIAYSLGFKSVAHFSRKFKAEFTFNPSDCRPSRPARVGAPEGDGCPSPEVAAL